MEEGRRAQAVALQNLSTCTYIILCATGIKTIAKAQHHRLCHFRSRQIPFPPNPSPPNFQEKVKSRKFATYAQSDERHV